MTRYKAINYIELYISDGEKENQADSDVILRRTHSFESDEM